MRWSSRPADSRCAVRAGQPHRPDDHLRDQPRHERQHEHKRDADDDHCVTRDRDGRLLGVQREQVIELEHPSSRTLHRQANGQAGLDARLADLARHVLMGLLI